MGLAVAAVLLTPSPAAAATPIVAWIAPGMSSASFTSTQTGAVMTYYDFTHDVFAGDISPDRTLFTYAQNTAPGAYHLYVARMPGR